jgi:hypothetical protein
MKRKNLKPSELIEKGQNLVMPNEKDHSIVNEVFFWMEKNQTRE